MACLGVIQAKKRAELMVTCLVTGGTRGAGRGMAIELGAAGATVYVTGRTTRASRSPLNRAETIEETAELVTRAGGQGIAVRCDHLVPSEVEALARRVEDEQDGRLDVLVDDTWGGDQWIEWKPLWEHNLLILGLGRRSEACRRRCCYKL